MRSISLNAMNRSLPTFVDLISPSRTHREMVARLVPVGS
jgi:hypothetical protein